MVFGGHILGVRAVQFSPDGTRIFTLASGNVIIWRRRHIEWWWRVFFLPIFWLTVVLGGGLVVSIWKDRRALKQTA